MVHCESQQFCIPQISVDCSTKQEKQLRNTTVLVKQLEHNLELKHNRDEKLILFLQFMNNRSLSQLRKACGQ